MSGSVGRFALTGVVDEHSPCTVLVPTSMFSSAMASPGCGAVQHDDSAAMVVDGVSLYHEEAAAWSAAGFKQFCTPVALAPGWHDLTLTYGSGPAGAASVLRFFVVDAAAVDAVQAGGQTAYEITWKVSPDVGSHYTSLQFVHPGDPRLVSLGWVHPEAAQGCHKQAEASSPFPSIVTSPSLCPGADAVAQKQDLGVAAVSICLPGCMQGPFYAWQAQLVKRKALLRVRGRRASAARAAGTPCRRACSPWTAAASATTPAAAPPSTPRCRRARQRPRPSPPRRAAAPHQPSSPLQCCLILERPHPLLLPTFVI